MSFVDFIDIKKTTKVIYSGSTSVQKFRYNAVSCKNICRNELVKEMLAMWQRFVAFGHFVHVKLGYWQISDKIAAGFSDPNFVFQQDISSHFFSNLAFISSVEW